MLKVYTKKPCVQCDAVGRWLDKHPEVEHEKILLTQELAVHFRDRGVGSAPVLEGPDGSLAGGFDTGFLQRFLPADA